MVTRTPQHGHRAMSVHPSRLQCTIGALGAVLRLVRQRRLCTGVTRQRSTYSWHRAPAARSSNGLVALVFCLPLVLAGVHVAMCAGSPVLCCLCNYTIKALKRHLCWVALDFSMLSASCRNQGGRSDLGDGTRPHGLLNPPVNPWLADRYKPRQRIRGAPVLEGLPPQNSSLDPGQV